MKKRSSKIRYAVIGLGNIAQVAILPGFLNATKNSTLAALVSDDPTKLRQLGKKYEVDWCGHYDDLEGCFTEAEIDAVYIALPNDQHREFTLRSAKAGVHVLCEKPLALNEKECMEMMAACAKSGVWLMTAYRLHFEHTNLRAASIINSGKIGEPRFFTSTFSMQVKEGIRTDAKAGGGTLYDIGIYCINAARYLFRAEPEEVFAYSTYGTDKRFKDIDEMTTAALRFPEGRLAMFTSSFGAADSAFYEVIGTRGSVRVRQGYEFRNAMSMEVTVGGRTRTMEYEKSDQFGPEIVYFSDCILKKREPEPSGLEGLLDVHIIRSLYESSKRRTSILLKRFQRNRRPTLRQEINRQLKEPLHLVKTKKPTR